MKKWLSDCLRMDVLLLISFPVSTIGPSPPMLDFDVVWLELADRVLVDFCSLTGEYLCLTFILSKF